MSIPFWAETLFHKFVDTAYAGIPRPFPGKDRLKSCKLISHRGEHDNKQVIENTIAAFDRVSEAGIWGIEFDIRWTKDLHPIVFHDPDLKRLFNSPLQIQNATLAEFKKHFPQIPSLKEVISRYGRSLHLMVEIKKEHYPKPDRQNQILSDLFADLASGIDYHFISLAPEMFQWFDFVPAQAFIPIAQLNTKYFSKITLQKKYGGIMGQYFLLNTPLIKKHLSRGQKIGTGFIGSKNCLFRELNRGVEWLFSNNAVEMQWIRNSYL